MYEVISSFLKKNVLCRKLSQRHYKIELMKTNEPCHRKLKFDKYLKWNIYIFSRFCAILLLAENSRDRSFDEIYLLSFYTNSPLECCRQKMKGTNWERAFLIKSPFGVTGRNWPTVRAGQECSEMPALSSFFVVTTENHNILPVIVPEETFKTNFECM